MERIIYTCCDCNCDGIIHECTLSVVKEDKLIPMSCPFGFNTCNWEVINNTPIKD